MFDKLAKFGLLVTKRSVQCRTYLREREIDREIEIEREIVVLPHYRSAQQWMQVLSSSSVFTSSGNEFR